MSFSKQVGKFAEKAKENMVKVQRGTALSVFSKIVMRTPVGNPSLWANPAPAGYTGGSLRANWQIGINGPVRSELSATDKTGSGTIAKGATALGRVDIGDSVFISNNLPYAFRVENGWSQQAPSGMVKVTVAEFQRIVKQNARKV